MRKVLIGLVAAAMLAATSQIGQAQETATTSLQTVRWEYLTVMDQSGPVGMKLARLDNNEITTLEELGEEGWEFVGYNPDKQLFGRLMVFKRPKSD